jgi:hypothetical protein
MSRLHDAGTVASQFKGYRPTYITEVVDQSHALAAEHRRIPHHIEDREEPIDISDSDHINSDDDGGQGSHGESDKDGDEVARSEPSLPATEPQGIDAWLDFFEETYFKERHVSARHIEGDRREDGHDTGDSIREKERGRVAVPHAGRRSDYRSDFIETSVKYIEAQAEDKKATALTKDHSLAATTDEEHVSRPHHLKITDDKLQSAFNALSFVRRYFERYLSERKIDFGLFDYIYRYVYVDVGL